MTPRLTANSTKMLSWRVLRLAHRVALQRIEERHGLSPIRAARQSESTERGSGQLAKRAIKGSRAIVTGASSGIGRAIALELGKAGADVVAVARRADRLEEVAKDIEAMGARGEAIVGDITDPKTRQSAIDCANDRFGGLDILVNNAGISGIGRFEDASQDRLRRVFEVNLFALIELTRVAIPLLKQGNNPIIVNVSSILGHIALPNLSEYSATKFAVRGFSNALRAELRSTGIDVLVVSPATVETEIWDRMIEETGKTSWRARRGATPEFVAKKTLRAMRRGRREVFPGPFARIAQRGNRLFPSLVAWIIERRG